ncbi:MAG: aminoglycoside 6-adenylyltransferase, partial [Bacillota bacterium]|nr:aminoglycoside 6-adenylyltransferase [Bacillota bacterium]
MRSEQAMFDLILGIARDDPRIRAVIMNGSRASPSAPKDCFQDFDIVYVVTETASLLADHSLPGRFGELMIMQMPEAMGDPLCKGDGRFVYLMQFTDGNRVDLTLLPVTHVAGMERDSQNVLLLDKDGLIEPFPPSSDAHYLPKPPTPKQFADCCNEFWWVGPYVAKGLWRDELTYAMSMLEIVRNQLTRMLTWHAGARTGFARSIGKSGKYLRRYLEPELWDMLIGTYPRAEA